MKTFSLVLCFIGVAALLAGFHGPAADTGPQIDVPTIQVDLPAAADFTLPSEEDGVAPKATCFNCSKSSTGACKGKQQCRGSRSGCRNKGCKITGTSSCSSAANVKKC